MNVYQIELLLGQLGQAIGTLNVDGLDFDKPLENFSAIGERKFMELEPGVELDFWTNDNTLRAVRFSLVDSENTVAEYKGQLPPIFSLAMLKDQVRTIFGEPDESSGPSDLFGLGPRGGWDAYLMHEGPFAGMKIHFSYLDSLVVDTLVFIHHTPSRVSGQ